MRVPHRMHGDAQNFSVNAQLLVPAYPVAVGCEQCELIRPMAHDTTRRELGRSGGLAYAGWTHQRIYAAFFENFTFICNGLKIAGQYAFYPVNQIFFVIPVTALVLYRQLIQQIMCEGMTETGHKQPLQ